MPWLSDVTGTQSRFLRGVDLDVERLVVDPDAAVAAVGRRSRGRGPCASRGSGSRSSSSPARPRSIASSVAVVDALAALERGELLLPGGEPLGLAGDLLGVDGVGLDPGPGVGLVVAGALEGALLVADLDLEPLAGARLLGDRPERLERAGLLLDLERRRVARSARASRAAPCRRALRAAPRAGRSGRRAPPRARAGPRPSARSARPSVPSCCSRPASVSRELGLHLGSAAETPVDLDVAQLAPACWSLRRSHSATAARTRPITAMTAPIRLGIGAGIGDRERARPRTQPPAIDQRR